MKIKLFQPSVIINAPRFAPGGDTAPYGDYYNYDTTIDETPTYGSGPPPEDVPEETVPEDNEQGSPPLNLNIVDDSAQQLPVMTGGQSGPAFDQLPEDVQEELLQYSDTPVTSSDQQEILDAIANYEPIDQDQLFEDLLARFREGEYVTSEEVDDLINSNRLSREDVQRLIGEHTFTEEQYASLFSQGLLTREEIESLIAGSQQPIQEEQISLSNRLDELLELGLTRDEAIAQLSEEFNLSIEDILEQLAALEAGTTGELNETTIALGDRLDELLELGLTRDEAIAQLSEEFGLTVADVLDQLAALEAGAAGVLDEDAINQLLQDYTTQAQLQDALSGYATQEQLSGLESAFQNRLTQEDLEAYLANTDQGYLTQEDLDAYGEAQDYGISEEDLSDSAVIQQLSDRLDDLTEQYADVTSQYEADAVNQQIEDTKQELGDYMSSTRPTGPRTGSTSVFDSGASFLPGGSPMANLIQGQREGMGQDAFSTYLKTFTPTYAEYEEPYSPQMYGALAGSTVDMNYPNPFTGGVAQKAEGGRTSNGIMDMLNYNTNVAPFQNAFRPNRTRNM